jgi:hypothetical protein
MMHKGIMSYFVAMEEAATGVANVEVEKVFYAKLEDRSILDHAAKFEDHEQWELRIALTEENASAGRIRIRKTTQSGALPEYVQTCKTKLIEGGEKEVANVSSADAFEQFKLLAEKGMCKRRYIFDVPGCTAKWEVDTYKNLDGTDNPWCKIDFEFTDGNTEVPPMLPGFTEIIPADDKTNEQKTLVSQLYETVFIRKNELKVKEV